MYVYSVVQLQFLWSRERHFNILRAPEQLTGRYYTIYRLPSKYALPCVRSLAQRIRAPLHPL